MSVQSRMSRVPNPRVQHIVPRPVTRQQGGITGSTCSTTSPPSPHLLGTTCSFSSLTSTHPLPTLLQGWMPTPCPATHTYIYIYTGHTAPAEAHGKVTQTQQQQQYQWPSESDLHPHGHTDKIQSLVLARQGQAQYLQWN
ncbi:hypothetical protein XELAEV_18043001mg [Xenopus laevis]|uniref:Uncharacterized protein n=1 Tax=Xenopus laevis TaxID=8355 RepID=A0A974C6F1_XENLA|nr:hypothetical protein XELAEV_18043001mg [Xenopus laevis]